MSVEKRNAKYKRQWQEDILTYRVARDGEDVGKAFVWQNNMSLSHQLSSHRPWNRWSYRASYPRLSAFLLPASEKEASRSKVQHEDFDAYGTLSTWQSTGNTLDPESLWAAVKSRPERTGSATRSVASRMVRIEDMSPIIANIVLGSTPRLILSYIAPFLERYLSFSNWGQVSLLNLRSKNVNSFLFEYHFAFYFVPQSSMDPALAVTDFRGLRKAAQFGPGVTERSRYIYEEQLSIVLIGCGCDVYTCYQLAERYFTGPYVKGAKGSGVFVDAEGSSIKDYSPSALFLSWIMTSLHHVRWRWQNAIEAVDNQVDSPSQIVFKAQNPDLLSDDMQFSRSKTYFWALQAYKLFEETLTETIKNWEYFRADALYRLNDHRMDPDEWDLATRSIDIAIDKLREKQSWVQKKSQEVRDLRDGLFGASSLFDNRTTVLQGDNIRLLTYVTLLYLPLSFCTGIFGMDPILPANLTLTSFAITLPVVTIFTILLISNLQSITQLLEDFASHATSSMRTAMKAHHREDWRETARALHSDRAGRQTPVHRRERQSSHWLYIVFLTESVFVFLPVYEIETSLRLLRRLAKQEIDLRMLLGFNTSMAAGEIADGPLSRAKRVKEVKEAANKRTIFLRSDDTSWTTFLLILLKRLAILMKIGLRLLLLPFWVVLVAFEYVALLGFYLLRFNRRSDTTSENQHEHMDQSTQHLPDNKSREHAYRRRARRASNQQVHAESPSASAFELPFVWLGFKFACDKHEQRGHGRRKTEPASQRGQVPNAAANPNAFSVSRQGTAFEMQRGPVGSKKKWRRLRRHRAGGLGAEVSDAEAGAVPNSQ